MKKVLENKTVFITGTARGIGKSLVEVCAAHGANIIAHARKEDVGHKEFCEKISEENGIRIFPSYFDLTDQGAVKNAFKEICALKISVDGLVNNAGIGGNSLFQMTRMEELREIFEVDFFGPYFLTQCIVKLMLRQKRGSIVNISSTSALDGNSGKTAYGSAKAALLTMTKCVAEELGTSGIRANVICPGVTETEMIKEMPEYIIDIERDATYLGSLAKTDDIAKTVVFLLSDLSSYITGQVIRVDGGKTLYRKRKN
ncbi:MAG: SDR family oxidoreductase [Lachnospiraceae bacterium]|jgi:3-oxoacyl-[acyl-carrier protein] reductase|nr:SDR family oxidoreductase [Lachnospiraceae bacterium]